MNSNTTKQQLITTGLNGLVGSKFAQIYTDKYDFIKIDIRDENQPVDITDLNQVRDIFSQTTAKYVFHLAAYTNVTEAWDQSGDKSGIAYKVNVTGTQNIVKACEETNKHLIHVSTAYVFDGEKKSAYTETDKPNPIEWYGQTKLWAEEIVEKSSIKSTILRIDQPFRADTFEKIDTAHRIVEGLRKGSLYPQFTNHYFGPTFIEDFSKIVNWVIRTGATGLFHSTSGEQWTDYDFAVAINDALKLKGKIEKGNVDEYLKNLNRPYQKNTALDCSRLVEMIDFKLTSIRDALRQVV